MAIQTTRRRGVLALAGLAIVASLAACGEDDIDVNNPPALKDELFRTYVAMGNSITAGYQSSGILDSTQRESYAFYLAQQMGTTYHYQKLNAPGCVAPIANFQTRARYLNASPTACAQIFPQQFRYVNNVAVPGATIADATNNNTPATNALTLLLSGGRSQVSRMLDADPTFITVWLGNNDVLAAATSGLIVPASVAGQVSPGITPVNTFTARYQTMVDSIKLAPRRKGGVLIGVVDVTNIPHFFAGKLLNEPTVKGALEAAIGGRSIAVVNCPTTTTAQISIQILGVLGATPAGQTPTISCTKIPNQPVVGDLFILDPDEVAAVQAAVTGYNAFIQQKATELGFAYWDPNPALAALRVPPGPGQAAPIPAFPNLASATATFGPLFSLDGVHPNRAAHKLIGNMLIDVINTKYGTDLADIEGS